MVFKRLVAECINDQLLEEGLVSSWDIHKFVKKLRLILGDNIENVIEDHALKPVFDRESSYGPTFSVEIRLKNSLSDSEQTKIDHLCSLFGYTNVTAILGQKTKLLRFEPLYPANVAPLLSEDSILFHISPKKYDNRILKKGLTPKGTETNFYHPGERVYLLYVFGSLKSKANVLNAMRQVLADNKGIKPEDMSIWKTSKQDNLAYFHDDATTSFPKGVVGVFVKRNIPPDQLIQIS